jgi:hypothetical protein
MNPDVLIPAVLTYLREKGGFATKTKLLKYLYLLDLETYRKTQTTLTGFDWVFHLYGPWARQYDEVLAELEARDIISLRSGNRPDLDTIFIDARQPVQLSQAFPRIVDELSARRIIEAWADRPTGEILDYVYFHTAPMRDAHRGEPLNLATVLQEEPAPDYRRASSGLDVKALKQRRRAFLEAIRATSKEETGAGAIPPRYDSEFWQALETLDRDPD